MTDRPTKMTVAKTVQEKLFDNMDITDQLTGALAEMGVNVDAIKVPSVVNFEKIAWEDLCLRNTRDSSTKVSDAVVVVSYSGNMEAEQAFKGYKGLGRIEFVTQYGEKMFVSTSMTYAETGERTPLWAWIEAQLPPFAMRFGRIETRKVNQFVIRAMPIDIEII